MQHRSPHLRRFTTFVLFVADLSLGFVALADPASVPGAGAVPIETSASSPLGTNADACENAWLVFTSIQFPRQLERAGVVEGTVSVAFTVGRGGIVENLQAVRYSHAGLVRPVLEAISALRCPRLPEGTRVTLPVSLKMERRRAS